MTRILRTALLVAIVATACTDSRLEEASRSTYFLERIESTGEASVEVDGIKLKIAADAGYASESLLRPEGSEWHATIRGHDLGLDDGSLRIGATSFGPLARGDRVSISSAGVTVNGERRGDLPPAK